MQLSWLEQIKSLTPVSLQKGRPDPNSYSVQRGCNKENCLPYSRLSPPHQLWYDYHSRKATFSSQEATPLIGIAYNAGTSATTGGIKE